MKQCGQLLVCVKLLDCEIHMVRVLAIPQLITITYVYIIQLSTVIAYKINEIFRVCVNLEVSWANF